MSEESEMWYEYREAQKARRAARLPVRTSEILDLSPQYEVKMITKHQFRINEVIDIYPIHHRWHILKTGKRGDYKPNNLKAFLNKRLSH